jgi:DsbC/DsbD-like thiol-disulfide interchange protein/cytochrome c biogenesis protein CcdA
MLTILRILGALLLAVPLAAQDVQSTLYTRVEGDQIRAVIEVTVESGWHIYHPELGHPEAVGMPTTVELTGAGIEWGEVIFPVPHIEEQPFEDSEGEPVWIQTHQGRLLLYVRGVLSDGAEGRDVTADLNGLVCEESCLPWSDSIATQGPGPDEVFASFPAGAGEEVSEGLVEAGPTEDRIVGGHADATFYTRVEGNRVHAVLEVKIEPGWHLYHPELGHPGALGIPTTVELEGKGASWWGDLVFPEPHELDQGLEDANGEPIWIWSHEGTILIQAEGQVEPGTTGEGLWGRITGQTCNAFSCVDYEETFVSQGPGPDEYFSAMPERSDAGAAGEGEEEDDPLLLFLLFCVGGGLFALMMPCTYPMIPITISFFTKQAEVRKGNVLPLSLSYGVGIVLIFIALGVGFGPLIIPFATHEITNFVIGALFLYFAFVLFGLINLQPPRFLMNAAGKAQTTGGLAGVFLMGATLVITSFTCTAPIVGTILALGGSDGNYPRLILGMGVFGLTMAVPFVVLSLVPGRLRAIPKSGEWMNTLKFFLGFVEVAASMKFFSNVDVVLNEGARFLPRGPFLAIWGVIFALAALFLFGFIFQHGGSKAGPVRLATGALVLVFAGYNFYGATGKPLDIIMTAIAPPLGEAEWTMVKDDYDEALRIARVEEKLLLVNFTGHS